MVVWTPPPPPVVEQHAPMDAAQTLPAGHVADEAHVVGLVSAADPSGQMPCERKAWRLLSLVSTIRSKWL